jgi:hypothetical protein
MSMCTKDFQVLYFFQVLQPQFYTSFSSPYACYMTCPFHSPYFENSNKIWRRVQIVQLFTMPIPTYYCRFSLSNLFSSYQNTIFKILRHSFNVRGHTTHPHEITGKLVVFCKLVCAYLGFEINGSRFSRNVPLVNFFVKRILVHKTRSGKKRKMRMVGKNTVFGVESLQNRANISEICYQTSQIFRVLNMPPDGNYKQYNAPRHY